MTFTPDVEIDMKKLGSAATTDAHDTINLAENDQIYSWREPT